MTRVTAVRRRRWALACALACAGCPGGEEETESDSISGGPGVTTVSGTNPSTTDDMTTEGPTTSDPTTTTNPTTTTTDPSTTEEPTDTTEPTTDTTDPTTDPTTTTDPTDPTDTTGDPPCPDSFPQDGAPCELEGQICGGGCEDPCSFCNLAECTNGVWSNIEVFPAECLSCAEICPYVVVAECEGGPPDYQACLPGCEDAMAACQLEYNQMLACAGVQPKFSCQGDGRPTIEGCEGQFATLYACLDG